MALSLSYRLSNSCWSFGYEILVPIATLLLIASSIFLTRPCNSAGTSPLWLYIPEAAAFKVESLKSLCASVTCSLVTVCWSWNRSRSETRTHCICKHTRSRCKTERCSSWRKKSERLRLTASEGWRLLIQKYRMLTSEDKNILQLLQRSTKTTLTTWWTDSSTSSRWTSSSTKTSTPGQWWKTWTPRRSSRTWSKTTRPTSITTWARRRRKCRKWTTTNQIRTFRLRSETNLSHSRTRELKSKSVWQGSR